VERFAAEVAPAVRELVASERATTSTSTTSTSSTTAGATALTSTALTSTARTTAAVPITAAPTAAAPITAAPADNSKKRASALGVAATPDPGVRLSAETLWDEEARPVAPAPDPEQEYSDAGRSHAQDLVAVHDHLRAELAQLRDMIAQVAAGSLDAGTARNEISKLTMRQNQWTVGAYCESYCRLVGLHHTIEDTSLFAGLRRMDGRLAPVTQRLSEEHHVIAGLLSRVDAALVALVTDPVRGMPALRTAVDLLTDALVSHLSYEEQQILEPLAQFGPALYG